MLVCVYMHTVAVHCFWICKPNVCFVVIKSENLGGRR